MTTLPALVSTDMSFLRCDTDALACVAVRNNLWDWQELQPLSYSREGYPQFYQFCDALEVKDGVNARASVRGEIIQEVMNAREHKHKRR